LVEMLTGGDLHCPHARGGEPKSCHHLRARQAIVPTPVGVNR